MIPDRWTLVDCHVHVHAQFDAVHLLDAAGRNFELAAGGIGAANWSGAILLTEMSGVDWFGKTSERISRGEVTLGRWRLTAAREPHVVVARNADCGRQLSIVSGRQVETSERIEVLALFTRAEPADGRPLDATLADCHAAGALVVLPWGVGKWLGSRGKLVDRVLTDTARAAVLAGDNGGRPWFWARPGVFSRLEAQGRAILPGTDPLPLADQATRVGSYGLAIARGFADDSLARDLKNCLLEGWNPAAMQHFGRPERAARFIINQLRLRL